MRTDLKTAVIELGRQKFTITELTFGRLKKVLPIILLALPALKAGDPLAFDKIAEVIVIAIEQAHPDVKAEQLDELPIRPDELLAAVQAIAKLAGLEEAQTDPKVEAVPSGTGTSSTLISSSAPVGAGSTSTAE